ncbi:Cys/Met metabolism PLP-dependent enzyme-domain-containing protein [Mycena belliarum]|uniref:Cys/Met metabolism PLP-dependent enzyme-domain-containing protein n=1 Tax=Mycena belliarum TaxID=1033014 RepID=A0AAD6XWM0_9AGAR|nr:Cys/Met metabolism PLP-dependent enzyme-domain-containing protein [Mycena belliae]
MSLNLHTQPGFETLQLHGGQRPDPHTKARAVPIFQTAGFVFNNVEHGSNLASMKEKGYLYSRVANPTVSVFEERMALLEGGVDAVAAASGQSAITLTITALANCGDNIVTASRLYGGTYNLFKTTLKKYGITSRFVMSYDVKDFEAEIDEKTKLIYVEIIANSDGTLTDVRAMADLAHRHGLPLVVDSTFAMGGYIIRPIEHGADIVVHSATKWLGGHGTTLGGVLIDSGNFDWRKSDKFPSVTEPCLSQDNTVFAEKFYPAGLTMFIRAEASIEIYLHALLLRDTGPCLSAMSAFMILQGIETLSLRAERHCENALAVARYLRAHRHIKAVYYAGLPDHPSHELAVKTLRPNCYGSIITFCVEGKLQNAITFIENLRLASHLANVGDAKTLVILPFVTIQAQLTEDERVTSGVTPGLIRLSVGIESVVDIIGDLDAALALTFPE